MNTTFYIFTHKNFEVPSNDGYVPIEVGRALRKEPLPFLGDDTGNNISNKNPNYCELTGLYWIWQNDTSDIVGVCHYRRYFSKYKYNSSPKFYLSTQKAERLLDKYDIILPNPFRWKRYNVATGYYDCGEGKKKDLETVECVIKEKYLEYLSDYHAILSQKTSSYCNMMVCKKEVLNEYCAWLFDILFEVEKRTDLTEYTPSEARIYGYLSEILLNVWVRHNQLRVKYMPMTLIAETTKKRRLLQKIEKIPFLINIYEHFNYLA